jgi:hypothetical protein
MNHKVCNDNILQRFKSVQNDVGVKAHYNEPLWNTLGFSIIVHTIQLFQKHGTFNFGFLSPAIIIFTNIRFYNFLKNIYNISLSILKNS